MLPLATQVEIGDAHSHANYRCPPACIPSDHIQSKMAPNPTSTGERMAKRRRGQPRSKRPRFTTEEDAKLVDLKERRLLEL